MRTFAIKTTFQSTLLGADDLHARFVEAIEDAFPDIDFRFVLLADEEITDSEWDRENALDAEVTAQMNAGFNPEPLPEDMPRF